MAFTPVTLPQLSISLPCPSLLPRGTTRKLNVTANYSVSNFASLTARNLSRRMLLSMGAIPILYNVNLALGAPIPQMEEPEILRIQYQEASQWSRVQDIVDGEGPAAKEGDVVAFNYVCRRSNGYFVYSTVDQFTGEAMPVTLTLDEKQIIKGLKDVLIGMKVGGKRRALIPPSTGYVNESLKPIPEEFGPRRSLLSHANEPLIFEVQLLKIL
ncbi:peptidyl-prolyl cis-trans isomerase FKBP16-1, chloroplastic-like [Chenopodium quinoa]|uniref:peptidyl-prolyl cis-trans isomerase FKBP16-1, chloroplastic-like n=1 Tax=Chenopodium quinoa TaxID=63459 RepID=UPI000B793F96|nr:peptidyl-prolyl cis-trans isomerase FKBP16-1, chloroplastic-like [Chenopodium quinoa]